MNIVTTGETTDVAIIPIGAKLPKSLRDTGAVKICAPVEEPRELARYEGNSFIYKERKKAFVKRMPASAV